MRLIGFVIVVWVLFQVYPHVHIDFAPPEKEVAAINGHEKFKVLEDGLLDYQPK